MTPERENLFNALVASLSYVIVSDGKIDIREVAYVRDVLEKAFGSQVREEIVKLYSLVALDGEAGYLDDAQRYGAMLAEDERHRVYYASVLAAHADRKFDAEESNALFELANALSLKDDKAKEIRASAHADAASVFG